LTATIAATHRHENHNIERDGWGSDQSLRQDAPSWCQKELQG
jgi:hypothetical protein